MRVTFGNGLKRVRVVKKREEDEPVEGFMWAGAGPSLPGESEAPTCTGGSL